MPAPAIPADAAAILARTGHRGLIRYLVDNPDSYYGDIKDATGAAVSSLTRDLRQLESIGVVHTDVDHPLGARRGRAPRYRVDAERVQHLIELLRTELLG
ncbi:hypothetical protein B0I12_002961 [Microbacterium hydrothermale]|uniref:transcriptional regulator n=1 Tax=Microbacterium hydrothermale TaxID=857427 RepID=UPI002227BDF3|nr:transcriptional regulator [Microbacterium hydrothermale]MCW2165796.1 hypothetical protein [Microbacterium hydrothermale]